MQFRQIKSRSSDSDSRLHEFCVSKLPSESSLSFSESKKELNFLDEIVSLTDKSFSVQFKEF